MEKRQTEMRTEQPVLSDKERKKKLWTRTIAIVLAASMILSLLYTQYWSSGAVSARNARSAAGNTDTATTDTSTSADDSSSGNSAADLAALYARNGDYAGAEAIYTQLIDSGNTDPTYYLSRGECRLQQENYSKAIEDFQTYLASGAEDQNGTVSALLGAAFYATGSYTDAGASFRKAVDSGYSDASTLLSQALACDYKAGSYEYAVKDAEKLIAITNPPAAENYYWLGLSKMGAGDLNGARKGFDQAISMDDSITDVYYYRGITYMNEENYQAATDDFTVSIARGQSTQWCAYNRALCEIQLNEIDAATADLKTAADMTDDTDVQSKAADLLNQINSAVSGS